MELEELQSVWSEMSMQLENQKKLTHKLIMDMTQEKYNRKFQKFVHYEGLGAIVCIGAAIWLLLNLHRLDTWYFMAMGLLALAFLVGLPVLVLLALRNIKNIRLADGTYSQTLLAYARAKNKLLYVQRLGIRLGYIFALISLPLSAKLMNDKDVFQEGLAWLWFLPAFLLFIFLFSRWGYRCYVGATNSAEQLLRDLE